jgi:hypothetical protein
VIFGNTILGASLTPPTQSNFWGILDSAAQGYSADCLALAGLTAYVTAQLGVPSAYGASYPPLAASPMLPAVTNATTPSQSPLPPLFQDSPLGNTLYYTLVYFNAARTYPNQIEGYFQVWANGPGNQPTGFTVGPAAGPFIATTCQVYPNTFANQVAFNVISQSLIAIDGGSNDLYWLDYNTHPKGNPQAPPSPNPPPGLPNPNTGFTMTRTGIGCQPSDLLAAPPITWPIR